MREAPTNPASEAVLRDLAPTGRIRACSTAGNPALNTRDPVTGELRGVAADLTQEVGARLEVAAVLTGYTTDAERNPAIVGGECDIIFTNVTTVPVDLVDLTTPMLEADLTLVVPASSAIQTMADADQPGVRIGAGTEPAEHALREQIHFAEVFRTESTDEGFALLVAGHVDALASNREGLLSRAGQLPGSRILEDRFGVVQFALAMPKGRAAGMAFLAALLEDTKASGFLADSLERAGTRGVTVAGPAGSTGTAQAVAHFYQGKTLTIIVANPPGGGSDATAHVLARYLGNHLPGNPNAIVANMPGAAGLSAANYLHNLAESDGLTIGTFGEGQIVNQLTDGAGIQFDARQFGWLGTVQRLSTICLVRADSPYATPADLLRRDLPPLMLGGSEPGIHSVDFPRLMNATLGANLRVVSSYTGFAAVRLAVESGELDGACASLDTIVGTAQDWLATNYVNVLVYAAPERDPGIEAQFPGAARAEELAADPEARRLLRAGTAHLAIARPFVAPPGVPTDRLRALQEAFTATMQDSAFVAEMHELGLEVSANSADEALRIVNEILDLPPDLAVRLAQILK